MTPLRVPPSAGDGCTNAQTLAPLVALYTEGLLVDNYKFLYCTVGEYEGNPIDLDDPDIGLKAQIDTPADQLVISKGNKIVSNYLFTRYYDKSSKANRVIAADAGCVPGSGKAGSSPNHGKDGKDGWPARVNVLFKDGHVKQTDYDFTVEGSLDTGNLWDDIDPPTATDLTKTQIGHY